MNFDQHFKPDFPRKPFCQTASNQLCFCGADGIPSFKNLSDCAGWLMVLFFYQYFAPNGALIVLKIG